MPWRKSVESDPQRCLALVGTRILGRDRLA